MVARRWRFAVVLRAGFGAVSALIASRAEDGTPHPGGIEFIAAVGWRGHPVRRGRRSAVVGVPDLLVFATLRESRLRRRTGGVVGLAALDVLHRRQAALTGATPDRLQQQYGWPPIRPSSRPEVSRYTTACSRVLQRFTVGSLVVRDRAGRRANRSARGLELLPSRHNHLGTPPGRASSCWRLNRLDVDPAAHDQPRSPSSSSTCHPSQGHRDPRRASERTVPAPARAVHDLDRRSTAAGFQRPHRRPR